eukprot:TRINITY_DN49_c0_g1_i8.p1 TRINITY_DN49_c0_g1~~TRINITY_DN49_c0_g1_i8.p1  ORF type:complete len:471 (-),score=134.43 TRINITY_DN49_c0_g1_i8:79-1491(-)
MTNEERVDLQAHDHHHDGVKQFSLRVKLAVASIGFFTDAYDLFVINLAIVILDRLYGFSKDQDSLIKTTVLVGAVCGQLLFGLAGDSIGRFTSWIATMTLIIVGAVGSAFAWGEAANTIAWCLGLWRLFLGIGIGGEYPLSSVVPAEASGNHSRGRNIALVFAMQGWGNLFAPLFIYVLLKIFGQGDDSLKYIWRVALGFGAVPCILTSYFRLMMYKEAAAKEAGSRKVKVTFQKIRENSLYLVGTAGSWFLFDIVFYANGLYSAEILAKVFGVTPNDMHNLNNVALSGIVLGLMSLPGYYTAVLLIDRVGRLPLQRLGFLMMAILYFILGGCYDALFEKPGWFVFLYGLTFYFANFGPNTTTFVLPAEVYDEDVRSTFHGLSAAAGKMGAVLGSSIMGPLFKLPNGHSWTFVVAGSISVLGLLLSMTPCVPETRDKVFHRRALSDALNEEAPLLREKDNKNKTTVLVES